MRCFHYDSKTCKHDFAFDKEVNAVNAFDKGLNNALSSFTLPGRPERASQPFFKGIKSKTASKPLADRPIVYLIPIGLTDTFITLKDEFEALLGKKTL